MGKASSRKRKRRKLMQQADSIQNGTEVVAGEATSKLPPSPFQNALLRPTKCLMALRGKDPKQALPDGQLLITLEGYAIVPLEQYRDLVKVAKKRVDVIQQALRHAQAKAAERRAMAMQNARASAEAAVKQGLVSRATERDIRAVLKSKEG